MYCEVQSIRARPQKGEIMYSAPTAERLYPETKDALMAEEPLLFSQETDENDNSVDIKDLLNGIL